MTHASTMIVRSARAAFTLVELMIGTVILFLLALGLVESVASLGRMTEDGSIDAELQTLTEKAITTITTDLKRTGFDGDYPHTFEGGVGGAGATIDFGAHDHVLALQHAEAGDPDFGASREVVYLLPADADANGVPDIDGNGELVWDATQFSFVLVTHADGINYLERRRNAGVPQTVAHHVERVTFETVDDDPFVPIGAVRVRVWLRKRDDRGVWRRCFAEALVSPRNNAP